MTETLKKEFKFKLTWTGDKEEDDVMFDLFKAVDEIIASKPN